MEDESDAPDTPERESPPKMSMTPSWVMLGFVLGAVFVWALPPLKKAPPLPPRTPPTISAPPKVATTPPQLSTIEAVFYKWGDNAVWHNDTTEVALWNTETETFDDFYEVRRLSGALYFRTIPSLSRRIINRGKPVPECPLQFTETEEQYREWLEHGRSERRTPVENR
jgi:hypothetical protein